MERISHERMSRLTSTSHIVLLSACHLLAMSLNIINISDHGCGPGLPSNLFCSHVTAVRPIPLDHAVPRCAQKTVALVDGVLDQLEAPQGLLTVKVVEAVNVPRSDLFSEPDPYLVYAPCCVRGCAALY